MEVRKNGCAKSSFGTSWGGIILTQFSRLRLPWEQEVIDCCPGCPGPIPLDWMIRIDEKVLPGIRMRIEGLTPQQLSGLKIQGAGKMDKNGKIDLQTGETRISGIPTGAAGKVPVAFLESVMDAYAEDGPTGKKVEVKGKVSDLRDGGIVIAQYAGRYRVNRFAMQIAWRPCGVPVDPIDELRITNNTGNDNAIALMDFRDRGAPLWTTIWSSSRAR